MKEKKNQAKTKKESLTPPPLKKIQIDPNFFYNFNFKTCENTFDNIKKIFLRTINEDVFYWNINVGKTVSANLE